MKDEYADLELIPITEKAITPENTLSRVAAASLYVGVVAFFVMLYFVWYDLLVFGKEGQLGVAMIMSFLVFCGSFFSWAMMKALCVILKKRREINDKTRLR